jgi:hypothetical protein
MHNASKVLLGSSLSSAKEISTFDSDPATYKAGLCVSLASTGGLSLLSSAGMRVGVSLGKSLSDSKKTAVLRTGEGVPVQAHLKRATGTITVSSYANLVSGTDDSVSIAGTAFTAQAGAATPGAATFQAATSNAATATSLAAQINAHATVSLKVYAVAVSDAVILYSVADGVGSTGTGNDIAVSYTDNDSNVGIVLSGLSGGKLSGGSDTVSDIAYIAKGAKMYINNATGKADINISGFCTISDAIYVSEELTGVDESAVECAAVLVDMPGGL